MIDNNIVSMEVLFMIFNLKDIDMNNYISWVYSELLGRIQTAENNISDNSDDIYRINGFVGFDGQLVYSVGLPNEQIPENSDLNDYTMTGTYYCSGTSVATTIAHSPTTYNYKVVVENITASYVLQTVIDRLGGRWSRSYAINSDTWTDWVCSSLNNISKVTMNNNGELLVTRADGVTATFKPETIA